MNIEDGAMLMLKRYAEDREISLGQAASDLIHRGVESLPTFETKNGWVVFDIPVNGDPVLEAEQTEYDEEFRRAFSPQR